MSANTKLAELVQLDPAAACIDLSSVNEDSLASEFARTHKDRLRYDHVRGKWFKWDGMRWCKEEKGIPFHWARELCRKYNKSADKTIAKIQTASAVEKYCRHDPVFAVTNEIWDQNDWLLTTPNGTVDLKTGAIGPNDPNNFITKLTAVSPEDSEHPIWDDFLAQITNGDLDFILFLQRMSGYILTGCTREHALFFLYGSGGNGKGTFMSVISKILGDNTTAAGMEVFTASKWNRHATELARLDGARLVTASETEEGRAWAETRIKSLTGGDPITANFMRQDYFTYNPKFKLVFSGNHKPRLKAVDDAARRRFNILPFNHVFDAPDKELSEKLKSELPAILSWMIKGCLDWLDRGLAAPKVVQNETKEYFDQQDLFAQWLEERTKKTPDGGATSTDLFSSWSEWAHANGERAGNQSDLNIKLQRAGYEQVKNTPGYRGRRGFKGVEIKQTTVYTQ